MILFINEKKISPQTENKQNKNCIKIIFTVNKKLFKKKYGIKNDICENKIEPTNPAIVLFGLYIDNFGPLKIFPKIYPPISENQTINRIQTHDM